MPRITARRLAGLSLLFNLPFVLLDAQRASYDAYSHIFLADHYRQNWWSLWEPRWYLGFSMASYPPLAHQLIALLSWPINFVLRSVAPGPEAYPGAMTWDAEEAAFVLLLLAGLVLLPLALRSFARLFIGPRTADLAGLLTIILPGLSVSAWAFGQLPTVLATGVILLALERGAAFARAGRWLHLVQAAALAGTAAVLHHGVFLLVPFAGLAVGWRVLAGMPRADRRAWLAPAARLGLWALASGLTVAILLWPFLLWSRGQSLQAPIDHASRHNFLFDSLARWYFFWPMYGPLLLLLPWAAWAGIRHRRRWLPLLALMLVLFVLGLGGTTPLPRLLFGAGWAWLTYDRFALWASLCLLPFAGMAGVWLWRRADGRGRWAAAAFVVALGLSAAAAGWLAVISHAQPPAVDLAPLAIFLDRPENRPYRYFTLGFGDSLAKLSAITQNGTPDGDYHTARPLPELRASGLGSIDTALWTPPGTAGALPFLAAAGRYGARFAFVNHSEYTPLLAVAGWHDIGLVGRVEAWEYPGVTPVPAIAPPETSPAAAIWWGAAPLTVLLLLAVAALAVERRRWPSRARWLAGLVSLRKLAWGGALVGLALWWMHVLRRGPAPGIYFTYQSISLYATDAAAALGLAAWLGERALRGVRPVFGPRAIGLAGLLLVLAAGLSAPGSVDPALSAAFALHLLLMLGWYWLTINDPPQASRLGRWLAVGLIVEAVVAAVQSLRQSTAGFDVLFLRWPGATTPEMLGASVVQTASGLRWLRAYGTLPHPNILGGFLLIGRAATLERYLASGRRGWLAAAAAGAAALAWSFSRAGWLGATLLLAGGAGIVLTQSRAAGPRYWRWAAISAAAGLAALLPVLPLVAVRADIGQGAVSTERRSVDERLGYIRDSLRMLEAHPLLGVGAGAYVEALAGIVTPGTPLEPVHSVPILIAAETGGLGALAALALGLAIAWRVWRRWRGMAPAEWVWALALGAIAVVGLLDHYWWTAPPAQLAFTTVLGLWVAAGRAGYSAK